MSIQRAPYSVSKTPLAAIVALCAIVMSQIVSGYHAQSAEPHDLSACVICQLGDRLDDGALPPALVIAAPALTETMRVETTDDGLPGQRVAGGHARGPPLA